MNKVIILMVGMVSLAANAYQHRHSQHEFPVITGNVWDDRKVKPYEWYEQRTIQLMNNTPRNNKWRGCQNEIKTQC
jgi:hypothetical protein